MTTRQNTCPYPCSDYFYLGDCRHIDWRLDVTVHADMSETDDSSAKYDDTMEWNRFVLASAGLGNDEDYGYGDEW